MATTPSNSNSANTLRLDAIKEAGYTSLWVGLATGMTVFAVQAAVTAGKAVIADTKNIVKNLK